MKLNVYQGETLVGSGPEPVHVDLAAKDYPAGTFTGEREEDNGTKSKRFSFPAVTVKPVVVPVTGVTLSQATATGDIGRTVELTATVAPENATDKTVTWSTSDKAIATVDAGTVTFVAAGTATITATVGGQSATTKVTVKVPAEEPAE
ncbi:Ig-like domain-containing protein [Levilactobacillus namurensis]|uniref:Ig-like domain-containing protein n=1 Tax=Levilactobacillus namurensis TaxID=380393 RepID=UPI001E19A012|nr:Ig-like domain-containing protein [Levilactobacillus namurensis]HJE44460.1 Ig-like domain-containing protein [Levilactobacillus namurensis]